jgi:hypothetical protein
MRIKASFIGCLVTLGGTVIPGLVPSYDEMTVVDPFGGAPDALRMVKLVELAFIQQSTVFVAAGIEP